MCPHIAQEKLVEGNKRFATGKSIHPNLGDELRNSLVNAQKPFAAILSCSDSRVPIEIIFDVGLGDLFVVRTAGHVLSKEVVGSLEYAVRSLDVKFIMILGHDNCGAIGTALDIYRAGSYDEASKNIQSILDHIYPALKNLDDENDINLAVKLNIKHQMEDLLRKDPYLTKKIKTGELIVVGAKYCLETGLIEVFE